MCAGPELVGGELVVDVPSLRHQLICSEILVELMAWARTAPDRGLASIELAVRIGVRDVYQPGFAVALDALFGE